MSSGIEIAEIAMVNDLARLEAISHNLANVSTTGFRRDAVTAAPAALARLEQAGLGGFELANDALASMPEPAAPDLRRRTVHEQGTLRFTGNPLDLAIEGDAFFAVETVQGEAYARAGAFRLDGSGQLVTAAGWPVLSLGGPLRLETPAPEIDRAGRVWRGEDFLGQLKLVRFQDPGVLESAGGGLFRPSGGAAVEDGGESLLRQGYLENSNVQVSHEMVRLLELIRHFEAAQRVIRGYDDMLGTAVTTIADF